ncbi:MAG: class I SAM-dependent rRNA methyltransferase [Myxococcota bacterium]
MTRLHLRRGRAKPLWHGHPWVYSGAVARVEGECAPGDVVEVVDFEGRVIGRGFSNPRSQIVCRLATWRADEALDAAWLARRMGEAIALRRRLGLPSDRTDAYRLVNSEGDGLPGLVVDVYGDVAAVQFTALGLQLRAEEVFDSIERALGPRAIVEVGGQAFAEAEGFVPQVGPRRGEAVAVARVRENGLAFEVDLYAGQKTGLFLDQRENHEAFGALARGARVLDLHAYAGGFALHAARGGAASVVAVDVSRRAVERARENALTNGLAILAVEADAFHYLEAAPRESFDLVACDPPKFARARKDLDAALKGYRRLNALAMAAVARGGVLLTCSCSQLVSEEDFQRVIAGAAVDARRTARLLRVSHQAQDHLVPVGFPEGQYLKCLWLAIQ